MAFTIRHVRKRNGVFYYERRVPGDIIADVAALNSSFKGQRLYRRSLRTKSQADVFRAAEVARGQFEALVRTARGINDLDGGRPAAERGPVTSEVLAEISAERRRLTSAPWATAYVLAERGGEWAAELERMLERREWDAQLLQSAIATPGYRAENPNISTPSGLADSVIEREALAAPVGSNEFALVAAAIRQGMINGQRDIDDLLDGKEIPRLTARIVPERGISIRDAVDRYLRDKALRPKTSADVRKSLEIFEQAVGNKRLADLSRADFRLYLDELAGKTVGGRSLGSIQRPIAENTVSKRLAFLRAAINHAIKRGWFEGGNPAGGHDITAWVPEPDKSLMPSKRPFSIGELNLVFQHPWFVGCKSATQTHDSGSFRLAGAHYWAPILALFTGCRASEIGGLKLNEVSVEGPYPHLRIKDNEYRPTKGSYARSVPLLDALVNHGFVSYVERIARSGSDRLFPDWISPRKIFVKDDAAWSNATIIRSFNRTVIPNMLGLGMTVGARQEVTFHAFRGAFKSMLGLKHNHIPPNVINEVIGHSKGELDNRYVGVIPIEETYSAVRGCTFVGLALPSAPV